MLSRRLKGKFAAAVRRLLRPVVRQLIAYGVAYPTVSQMLKELYVDVAESEFPLPFKRQTDSRLALVTGLSRKEVAQLRKRRAADQLAPEVEDTAVTHVIGRWMAGPPYASPDGVPRRLPYEADDPSTPNFARLVRELGVDIPVRSVLDELIRLGIVELLPEGEVILRQEAHVPNGDVEGKLALLGSDPGEVFATIVHNIEKPENAWLQRKVVYDNIGSDGLHQLEVESRRLGEEFIRRANALLASYDRDRTPHAPGGRRTRVVLGAYYHEEQAEPVRTDKGQSGSPAPPGRIRRFR